ncbi:MAG: replication initiator protein A, partial [Pseudomonadota bacterium]
AGRAISNVLRFKAYDLLVSTNRLTGGSAYAQLRAAFERLTQTRIETNIRIGDFEAIDDFGLIDRIRIVRETRDGRMLDVEVTLSEWVMSAVKSNEVLTLHRNYFRLRKPLERRIYDLGRKHCGAKPEFTLNLDTLWKKAGSQSTRKEFRRLVRAICEADREHDHMPDYAVRFNDERDQLTFTRRDSGDRAIAAIDAIRLDPDTYEEAREAVPGYDIYYVEQEWRNWIASTGKPLPKKPDLAFIRFCATWYANNGKAA